MATTKPSPSPAGTPTEIPAVMKPSPYTSPTPVPTLRGQYVGKLGWFSGCLTLSTDADGYIIFLPSAYRLDHPPAAYVIYDEMGDRVAHEGDVVGLNAKPAASSGSSCQLYAPALEVSEIVDDQPGSLTTDVDGWSVSCGLTSQSDCKRVAESFINQLGWDYLTVASSTGRNLSVDNWPTCELVLPYWASGPGCWQISAPWPATDSWQPLLPGMICEVVARGKVDGIEGVHQFAGDYLGGAAVGPDWPPCAT
ncbi:MAG TPA: hypothetical protein VH371_08870 [Candidatus Limnocylindrales bacterium]|jgi:hypothetical protein